MKVSANHTPMNGTNMLLEIFHAAKIHSVMKDAHANKKGAVGLEGRMVDFPVLRQVRDRDLLL